MRWTARAYVHLLERSVPGNYTDGVKIFSQVLIPVLNKCKGKKDPTVVSEVKFKLPNVPTEDLFSRIKGKVFKCTIVNKGYGPEMIEMKLHKS